MYAPRPLLAACKGCPLVQKNGGPIWPTVHEDPQALIILDYPSAKDKFYGRLLSGPIGKKVKTSLAAVDIERYSVVCRIGCYPSVTKRLDKHLRAACKACTGQFQHDLASIDPHRELPKLFMGKWSSKDLGTSMLPLRSGASVKVPTHKLCKELPSGKHMVLDSPAFAWWGKPPMQVPWLAGLKRFGELVRGVKHIPPTAPLIEPNEEALTALENMGPVIGWDLETLGVDPLTVPITCIGISDGIRTVSVPWDDYSTSTEGLIKGVDKSIHPLHKRIREAVLSILHSDRIHVTQNGNYDVLGLSARRHPGRNDWDIMHAHAILWPEIPHGLEAIALQMIPELPSRWKTIFRAGKDTDAKGDSAYESARAVDLRDYNGYDCWATVRAKAPLEKELAVED